MSEEAGLAGLRVLVVEDDYYLATDGKEALELAGAEVMGPTAKESEALRLAKSGMVDCAVLDINLGAGPSFSVAEALREQSIPFLFTTGYDAVSIPSAYRDVERLEKPVDEANLVEAVKRLRR